MDYDINGLLHKMGIGECAADKPLHWHYIDSNDTDVSGSAHARFEEDGRRFIAEIQHIRKNVENDDGEMQDICLDTVEIRGRRLGDTDLFRITKVSFDGTEFDPADSGMIELCCSIFYARALDISEIMTKQRFDSKQAEYDSAEDRLKAKREYGQSKLRKAIEAADKVTGVVVPFKPRTGAPLQRI